ncbi:MAG: transporter substrate-binding domain-containing protein [Hyphomicrobium sp.]
MRIFLLRSVLVAVLLAITSFGASAQQTAPTEGGTLRVSTRVLPPMVTEAKGELGGFAIDLWREIARRLAVTSVLKVEPDVRALLAAVKSGEADLGIAAISITAERDKEFDFSQPMLDGGLQILIRDGGEGGTSSPLRDLLRLLFSRTILEWFGIALLLVLVPAHILWFVERGKKDGVVPDKDYFPGIFHAMWWAGSTLAAQGDQMPRHWLARVMALVWLFTSVIFIAFYTAQLTAALTVKRIQGEISGPQDLPGKAVATTAGSTAAAYLKGVRAKVTEVASIDAAFKALNSRAVDAVVFDAPILQHHAAHAGKGLVTVVGPVFREEDYGIAFPRGSVWRKRVDGALLSMREDGTYQALYEKWFAAE